MIARAPLVAAVLLVIAGVDIATGGQRQPGAAAIASALMFAPVALLARSVWPAVAGCAIGPVVAGFVGGEDLILPSIFAIQITGFAIGDRLAVRPAALGASIVATGLALHLLALGQLGDVFFVLGAFFVPFVVVGRIVRDRRARIDELRSAQAALAEERRRVIALAAEAERARIARDLEAVLAATVRAIESDLARAPDPPTAATFEGLHRHGSEAMAELRRLLGVLREPA